MTFARFSLQETAIIATNFSDQPAQFYIDFDNLDHIMKKYFNASSVIVLTNWLKSDYPAEYYFIKEFMSSKTLIQVGPYHSLVFGI